MDREEQAEQDRPRPKIVDKRVASGGHQPSRPPEPAARVEPEPPPQTTEENGGEPLWTPEEEAAARQMAQEIAERPGIEWVVNTAVTLANVGATKLQIGDPADAQICIDALAGILNTTAGRLEDAEAPLRQTLAQLQMAYAERVAPPPSHG